MRLIQALFPLLVLAACNGSNCQPPAVANAAPAVTVLAPLADVTVEAGAPVEIRYTDDDPDTEARTDVVAVSIGTFREIAIARDRPDGDGIEQTVNWDTAGVEADTYEIEIRSDDGESQTVETAPGKVTVTEPPPVVESRSGAWSDEAQVLDSVVMPDGTVVVTGTFGVQTTLGAGQPGETTLTAGTAKVSYFVARYEADGTLLWARHATSDVVGSRGLGVDAFPDGSCAVIGLFGAETTFSPGRPDEQVLEASFLLRDNAFVARYDADGTLLWIDAIRSDDNIAASMLNVAATPDGCALVAGLYVRNPTTFNPGRATEVVVEGEFAFGAKYDGVGTVVWARNLVSVGRAAPSGIASFEDGSFVACGGYDNTDIVLGQGEPAETLLADEGDNGWLARFHADGTLDWARRVSIESQAFFYEPAITPSGAVVVSGFYRGGDLAVAPGTSSATTITLPGQIGAFLARFEGDGAFAWLVALQNGLADSRGLACAKDDSCVLSVHMGRQGLTIAPGLPDETLVSPTSASGRELVTMRFAADGSLEWARADGPEGSLGENHGGVGVLPDGKPIVFGTFLNEISIGGETLSADAGSAFFAAVFEADGSVGPR